MEAVARLKNYPTSPRKMRLLADLIRGMEVDKALEVLQYSPKHPAIPLYKLLKSAINNWEQKNADSKVEDAGLIVKSIMVDGGRVLKRMKPAAQGRGYRIRKRSNHVTLVVASSTEPDLLADDYEVIEEKAPAQEEVKAQKEETKVQNEEVKAAEPEKEKVKEEKKTKAKAAAGREAKAKVEVKEEKTIEKEEVKQAESKKAEKEADQSAQNDKEMDQSSKNETK